MNTKLLLTAFCIFLVMPGFLYSQDFIRVGLSHDFKKKTAIETFSLDLNMTEKEDAAPVKYFLFNSKGFYLLPSSSVNLGDGITSSENNVMAQIKAGKMFFGSPFHAFSRNNSFVLNESIELNPSYNSDKNFEEKTAYAQIKIPVTLIGSVSNGNPDNPGIVEAFVVSFGPFTNIGYRWSRELDINKLYSTAGLFLDFRQRNMTEIDCAEVDDLSFRVCGNIYYIASDIYDLNKDRYAGFLKASVIKRILKKTYLGLCYKYGNDNPLYTTINTLELSFAVNY
ncbi:MAG: hypothetical protein LWX07_00925 [Bacteroidetes bacterium]|nr:hypothetical protein [Bacteroidota bacterium]